MRGQISIEMILLLAAVLAIVFLLVTQLKSTAGEAGQAVSQKSNEIIGIVDSGPACDPTDPNQADSFCQSLGYDHCDATNRTCVN